MQILQNHDYQSLRKNGKVIEQDGHGDKVIILTDGTFLKLFRRKRLVSSAAIWPYAQRFANNAAKLKRLGIPCPEIIQVYRIPSIKRDAVHYHPLPGVTLRQLAQNEGGLSKEIQNQFWLFVDKVQSLGIYFRSMHLGNVVLTAEGKLGLIDISDMRIKSRALNKSLRARNLKHIRKDPKDWQWLNQ